MPLTFEQLPEAIDRLLNKLDNIELLLQQRTKTPDKQSDDLLTVQQASEYLRISVQTIYGRVSRREIPHMKKGKRLYFSKAELTAWVMSGKKSTKKEIDREADIFLRDAQMSKVATYL